MELRVFFVFLLTRAPPVVFELLQKSFFGGPSRIWTHRDRESTIISPLLYLQATTAGSIFVLLNLWTPLLWNGEGSCRDICSTTGVYGSCNHQLKVLTDHFFNNARMNVKKVVFYGWPNPDGWINRKLDGRINTEPTNARIWPKGRILSSIYCCVFRPAQHPKACRNIYAIVPWLTTCKWQIKL